MNMTELKAFVCDNKKCKNSIQEENLPEKWFGIGIRINLTKGKKLPELQHDKAVYLEKHFCSEECAQSSLKEIRVTNHSK